MKAILVIDVDDSYINKEVSLIKFTDDSAIYCNEKLKRLPKPKDIGEFEEMDFLKASFEIGVNSIIYEILGEEE